MKKSRTHVSCRRRRQQRFALPLHREWKESRRRRGSCAPRGDAKLELSRCCAPRSRGGKKEDKKKKTATNKMKKKNNKRMLPSPISLPTLLITRIPSLRWVHDLRTLVPNHSTIRYMCINVILITYYLVLYWLLYKLRAMTIFSRCISKIFTRRGLQWRKEHKRTGVKRKEERAKTLTERAAARQGLSSSSSSSSSC